MNVDIRINISGAKSSAVGPDHGVTPLDLKQAASLVEVMHGALVEDRKGKRHGFYDLHKDKATIAEVKRTAAAFARFGFENLVVLGIGGSALGTTALVSALKPPYYNLLGREQRGGCPRIFVMDNVDPDTFAAMLNICPPEKTLFNVISKSGGTAETLSQLLLVLDKLEAAVGKARVKNHLVVTTGPPSGRNDPNPLLFVQRAYDAKAFVVPPNVGGRFSVFTPVGLFPAAMLGMDIDELIAGCATMDARCKHSSLTENPAYLRAAVHFLGWHRKGKSISVMMPYSDALRDIADWYRQLWAESLGKTRSLDGREGIECGQTPVKALGVTDQHSQLQLYLEGPNDKIITIMDVKQFRDALAIPKVLPEMGGAEYLRGSTMAKLINAECKATAGALREAGRPVISVSFPKVTAHTVAQMLYMLEVETAMAGRLFGVDAFDQPAVERIKVLTREFMGQKSE